MGKSRQSADLVSDNNIFVDIVNDRVGVGTTVPVGQLNVRTGPVIVGAATSTGTASQPLQVTGGAYVSGSVGIATTNPSQTFDVVGRAVIGGTGVDNALYVRRVTDNTVGLTFGYAANNSNGEVSLRHNAGTGNFTIYLNGTGGEQGNGFNEKFKFTSGGSLGIGRSNPSAELDVFGGANFTNRVLIGSATSTGTASQTLQVTGGAYVSGNVGVGTTNPTYKLHVIPGGSAGVGQTIAWFTSPLGSDRISIIDENSSNRPPGIRSRSAAFGLGLYADSGPIIFYNGAGDNARARFDTSGNFLINTGSATGTASQPFQVTGGAYVSGNLGIGTTNPVSRLHIYNGNLTIENIASGALDGPYIDFREVGFNDRFGVFADFGGSGDNNKLHLTANTSGAVPQTSDAKVTLLPSGSFLIGSVDQTGTSSQTLQVTGGAYVSGNLGIGKTNPSYKLDVVGDINLTGSLYQNGVPFSGGTSVGRVYFSVNS